MSSLLEVGRVIKPHGIRGEVIVALVTNRPEARMVPGAVLASDAGDLTVVRASVHQGRWIVAFAGVDDRNGAESLRGLVLRAPALAEEGALWVHELAGRQVVDGAGRSYGRVEALEAQPAGDLLVLEGGGLVPLRFVTATPPGRVVIDPPAGLVEPR